MMFLEPTTPRLALVIARRITRRGREFDRVVRGPVPTWSRAEHPCINCGRPGSHFFPPSMGEPGFWTCHVMQPMGTVTWGKQQYVSERVA